MLGTAASAVMVMSGCVAMLALARQLAWSSVACSILPRHRLCTRPGNARAVSMCKASRWTSPIWVCGLDRVATAPHSHAGVQTHHCSSSPPLQGVMVDRITDVFELQHDCVVLLPLCLGRTPKLHMSNDLPCTWVLTYRCVPVRWYPWLVRIYIYV